MYDTSYQPEAMQARYKFLPPNITELFEYGTVQLVVDDTSLEFALNDDQKAALLMEVEMILYFFLTRTGLVERLKESLEIDQLRATQITAKLEGDLFIIVDDLLDAAEKEFEVADTKNLPTTDSQPEPTVVPETLTPTPPVTPSEAVPNAAPLAAVKPMRTYSDDVNMSRAHSYGAFRPQEDDDSDEPTHSSSQDDVLRK